MLMDKENNVRVIALSDIWNTFAWHVVPIVLAAVLAVSALYLYARLFRAPKYQSTATLYILRQEHENDYAYTSSDFSLALNVVSDCDYMLKSHAVLDDVIDELSLEIGYKRLAGMISTRNPEGSRILEVTVESDSPALSKEIVDAVCTTGTEKITAAMGMDQVNVFDYGTINSRPSNGIGLKSYLLVGMVAAILVYVVYLTALILDDKVRSEDDVHKYLNLSVLGDIPNASKDTHGRKYGRYGKYSRYGKYGQYGRYGSYYAAGTPANATKASVKKGDEGNE